MAVSAMMNLDFEQGADPSGVPKGWRACEFEFRGGAEVSLETDAPHSGAGCLRVSCTGTLGAGGVEQTLSPDPFVGKRLRFSGYLRVQNAAPPGAGFLVRTACSPGREARVSGGRMLVGTTDWERCEIEIDVTAQVRSITLGVALGAEGTLWADDLALEEVGPADEIPPAPGEDPAIHLPLAPANPGFEQGATPEGIPTGWYVCGTAAGTWDAGGAGYEVTLDREGPNSGLACARSRLAKPITGPVAGSQAGGGLFGGLGQGIAAAAFLGKRVRLSSYLRTEAANDGYAALWMRVDENLASDNMHRRGVRGTTEWQRHEIILDVPEEAVAIHFGFFLVGSGTAWADDFTLGPVGPLGEGPACTG